MKQLIISFLLTAITIGTYAQRQDLSRDFAINGTLKSDYGNYPKGTPIVLRKVIKMSNQPNQSTNGIMMAIEVNGMQYPFPVDIANKIHFTPENQQQFWQSVFLHEGMYQHYDNKGYRYELRQELNEEANQYLSELSGLFYEDAYIEDYVQALFAQTTPLRVIENRPEVLSIRLLKSPNPDAYMLPNGTVLISTGLLSTLDSSEELMAIIASEMAHYVLDHQVINTSKAEKRALRAEFWGSVLSAAAEGFDQALYNRYEYYVPGTTYIAADFIACLINSRTSNRLGMTYTRKQEREADKIAQRFLAYKQIDPGALASALTKIKAYYLVENDHYNLSRYGNYAELDERIAKLSAPQEIKNRPYLKAMSGVTTYNAILQQTNKRFESAIRLANKNIDNKVCSDDDFVVLAKANMGLYSTPEADKESMSLIKKAKEMSDTPNLNAYKQEILLLLRMNKQALAVNALKEYMDLIAQYQQQIEGSDEANWAAAEASWANKLLQRISIL